jgi:hypothetical protein
MFRRLTVAGLAAVTLALGAAGVAAGGATQVAGAQSPFGSCSEVTMTGDLNGCWYTDEITCRAQRSGTVECSGREHFDLVDSLGGKSGTLYFAFEFSGKFELPLFYPEIRGRCNHRIVGGAGDFQGARGVIHFKDDVTAGVAYYTGSVLL